MGNIDKTTSSEEGMPFGLWVLLWFCTLGLGIYIGWQYSFTTTHVWPHTSFMCVVPVYCTCQSAVDIPKEGVPMFGSCPQHYPEDMDWAKYLGTHKPIAVFLLEDKIVREIEEKTE